MSKKVLWIGMEPKPVLRKTPCYWCIFSFLIYHSYIGIYCFRLYVSWRFMRGVETQFLALQKGLFEIIPQNILKPFDEQELEVWLHMFAYIFSLKFVILYITKTCIYVLKIFKEFNLILKLSYSAFLYKVTNTNNDLNYAKHENIFTS